MDTIVQGVTCPKCKDFIYSRAVHDFHTCSCKAIFVDGGFDYLRWGTLKDGVDFNKIKQETCVVKDATRADLYMDWNNGKEQYGILIPYKRPGDKKAYYMIPKTKTKGAKK